MKGIEIKSIKLTPDHAHPSETIKITVKVEEVIIPTPEPQMHMLPFALGDNQGGGF